MVAEFSKQTGGGGPPSMADYNSAISAWCECEGRVKDLQAINAELLAALEGPEESPQLTRVEYLDTLLHSIENNTLDADRAEDPDAVGTALSILRDLVTEGRAAIAKAKT